MTTLGSFLREYFTTFLSDQKAVSDATIAAYRDTWRLFLQFLASTTTQVVDLQLDAITPEAVSSFLEHLQTDRGNSVATRNLRLTAIKSAMAHLATTAPEHIEAASRIKAIPAKRQPKPVVSYLTGQETQTLLAAIDTTTWTGRRDHAMFALAAQTGLRLGELASLTTDAIRLGAAPYVACTGKGRKRRSTPLTRSMATTLKNYLSERRQRPGTALFPNPHGNALSSAAIQQRLKRHIAAAAAVDSSLANKNVTVHTLRHTAAMRFLEAGIDCAVIALWLGHEQIATTAVYLHADLNIKRAALERTRQPDTQPGDYKPPDALLAWLQQL